MEISLHLINNTPTKKSEGVKREIEQKLKGKKKKSGEGEAKNGVRNHGPALIRDGPLQKKTVQLWQLLYVKLSQPSNSKDMQWHTRENAYMSNSENNYLHSLITTDYQCYHVTLSKVFTKINSQIS